MPSTPRPLALALTLALAACGGGDSGGSTPTNPTTPPPADDRQILANPSFANDIQEIFSRTGCTAAGCHGAAPQAGLDLRASVAWQELVNVAATQESGRVRVIPGDPANSYLVIKIEGRQSSGTRMPQGLPALDNIDQTNIRNWISSGAQNN